ncbi:MAG: GNAT family N-acetyltransferase [Methylobacterium sp.]|jgi:GNAT superfamily N-acetyltransferase|nr:GNAT family N-acetyltransferase [Methylobacterium sp.]MCA3602983.1 GNAT family N-acetyltransferase [Methylobacterium sp.]MCA3614653.1 GNAT family N-acetyltransferase [Methylobacterium sp.]MCA4909118.1 GNAT family N-acetyltransferase [Methylobacterium sp.]
MLSDGYHFLPPGRLAVFTMFLRHPLRNVPQAASLPDGFRLERISGKEIMRYRLLFRAIGQDWLWFGRLKLDDAALESLLSHADHEAMILVDRQGDCGLVEIDFRENEPELAYLGLLPRLIGRGVGRALAQGALARANARGAPSLMVHTCNFDAPGALGFYRSIGFLPFANALEFFPDPRLDGTLPRDAAAHVPLIEE